MITLLNEFSYTGTLGTSDLLSPFMYPVLHFKVVGDGTITSPEAVLRLAGAGETIDFECTYTEQSDGDYIFRLDLSDVMKYLMRNFDGVVRSDALDITSAGGMVPYPDYFLDMADGMTATIVFQEGETSEESEALNAAFVFLAGQMPRASGFNLYDVAFLQHLSDQKWSKDTYNALFLWLPASAVTVENVTKGITLYSGTPAKRGFYQFKFPKEATVITADSDILTVDSGLTVDSVSTVITTQTVKYGALYNWYAATDPRNIANTGWHVPTHAELSTLETYLGGAAIAGGKLKETGLTYWTTPNTGADNSSKFNGRGNGTRNETNGLFTGIYNAMQFWCDRADLAPNGVYMLLSYDVASSFIGMNLMTGGRSIRLIKDSTILSDGEEGTYIGNDGKTYRTICIGTQVWLADNLCETKYRNGDSITIVTDNAAWAALVTEAMCYYDNDIDNAYTEESISEWLDDGKNIIRITAGGITKDIEIDYDSQCSYAPIVFQHPLLGYVSFPMMPNMTESWSASKGAEYKRLLNTLAEVNSLKEITGYEVKKKVSLSAKVDEKYWPLMRELHGSRHVYLFVGDTGDDDSDLVWLECEVSGGSTTRSNFSRERFNVDLILPEHFNVQF